MPKVIQYRDKCIGCGICFEMQPALWRMSKKDGKAVLLRGVQKKQVFILALASHQQEQTEETSRACPVNIIRIS